MGTWEGKSASIVALAMLIKQIESGDILPEGMSVDFGHKEVTPDEFTEDFAGWREFKPTNERTFTFKYRATSGGGE